LETRDVPADEVELLTPEEVQQAGMAGGKYSGYRKDIVNGRARAPKFSISIFSILPREKLTV